MQVGIGSIHRPCISNGALLSRVPLATLERTQPFSLEFHNVLSRVRWQLHFVVRAQACHGFGNGSKSWSQGHVRVLAAFMTPMFVHILFMALDAIERHRGNSSSTTLPCKASLQGVGGSS